MANHSKWRMFSALVALFVLLSLVGAAGPVAADPAQTVTVSGWVNVPPLVDPYTVQVVISRPDGREVARSPMAWGKYKFTRLAPGDYHLQVTDCRGELYDPDPSRLHRLTRPEEVRHLNGARGGSVTGQVADLDGRPLDQARVEFTYLPGPGQKPLPMMTVRPDREGKFALARVAPGGWKVKAVLGSRELYYPGVSDPGAAGVLQVQAGEQQQAGRFVFYDKTYSVSGRITVPVGVDYRNVLVWLEFLDTPGKSAEARLNPDGSYRLSDVPKGAYRLWVFPSERKDVPSVIPTLFPNIEGTVLDDQVGVFRVENANVTGIDIKPRALGVAAGKVILPAGVPTSDAEVHFVCCDYRKTWRNVVPLQSDGSYQVRAPMQNGGILLVRSKSGAFPDNFYQGTQEEKNATGLDNPANAGTERLEPLVVTLGGTVSGIVKATPGKNPQDYQVNLVRVYPYWSSKSEIVSGKWEFKQVGAGEYWICLESKKDSTAVCLQDEKGRDRQFRMDLGGKITGIELSLN